MARIEFSPDRSEERKAMVVSFDLCGFSDFCNQPDAYALLPKFLSALFDEVNKSFLHWSQGHLLRPDFNDDRISAPNFMKYTGDGALMIWLMPNDFEHRQEFCTALVRAMRKLQNSLAEAIPRWSIEWQVHSLPNRARFGIATGLVHPLRCKSQTLISGSIEDFAGYCINLAVRLQNHCPEVGFIIHEPVLPKIEGLVKMIAHGMKGSRDEPVLMFAAGMNLKVGYLKSKFLPIGDEPRDRAKAIQPENFSSEQIAALAQPRFEARFVGGPMNGVIAFLPVRLAEWQPITDVKDVVGKVIGREESFYQRVSEGPPLVYKFVSKKPCETKDGNWASPDYWTRHSSGS